MSTKKSPRKTAPTEEEQGSDEEDASPSPTRPLKWKTVESKQLNLRLANLYPPNSKGLSPSLFLVVCATVVSFSSSESRRLFRALEEEVEYLSPETTRIRLFGKFHDIPRRNVGYGDKGVVYKYSGLSLEAKEWTPTLREIKSDVESASGHSYNFVLVNRYADGGDCMGEHRDDEAELDPDVPIASLSLGAARDPNDRCCPPCKFQT